MTHFVVVAVVRGKTAEEAVERANKHLDVYNENGVWFAENTRLDYAVLGGRFEKRWPATAMPVADFRQLYALHKGRYFNDDGVVGMTALTDNGDWHESGRCQWFGSKEGAKLNRKTLTQAETTLHEYAETDTEFAAKFGERFLSVSDDHWCLLFDAHV